MAAKKSSRAATRKAAGRKAAARKHVATLRHEEAKRTNIPTAEYQSVMDKTDQSPIRRTKLRGFLRNVEIARRNQQPS